MYPDDPEVALITNEVLTSFNNFLPRQGQSYTLVPTIEQLWNEAVVNYQKEKRQIPGEESKSFTSVISALLGTVIAKLPTTPSFT